MIPLGKVQVLPHGGRVIGLYPREGLNVFWTNPSPPSSGWANLGGDRTWISPEVELFIADLARPMETYKVPDSFDPGSYRVSARGGDYVELETAAALWFHRSVRAAEMTLRKRVTELSAPDFPLPPGLSCAGYELRCELTTAEPLPPSVRPAIWNLLQVPGGGEIVVPLKGSAGPVAYFGRQRWRGEGGRIHALVPVAVEGYKFGVRADHCRGLTLYLNLAAPEPFLIVRRFQVDPAAGYFDVPFGAPDQEGCVQQVYVDDGSYGGFGEMEHHSPAIVPGGRAVTDVCVTWAFAGVAERLRELAETLLA